MFSRLYKRFGRSEKAREIGIAEKTYEGCGGNKSEKK